MVNISKLKKEFKKLSRAELSTEYFSRYNTHLDTLFGHKVSKKFIYDSYFEDLKLK